MRTIFGKQLMLYLSTVTLCFVVLGAVLSQVIRTYFTNQRVEYLLDSGQRIANLLEVNGFGVYGVFDMRTLQSHTAAMRQYLDAKWIVIDSQFETMATADPQIELKKPVYTTDLESLMDGLIVVTYGNLNNILDEQALLVGYPILSNQQVVGAVLVYSAMSELRFTITEMYRATLLGLVITGLFAFVLVYFSCRTITKPLRQMNDAAKVIASGDFDKRIAVRGKDEVGQLAASLNHMAASLQEQEKIRSAFISNISHDLRSPLTSMRGFLRAIDDGTAPPEQYKRYIGIVLDESERLLKLSNDILDVNRTQDTGLQLTDFDINDVIRKAVMQFEKRAMDKALQIDCRFAHETDIVRADKAKIERVIYNLLDNAVKFVDNGGAIVVETTVADGKVRVGVQDNGCGLSLSDQKHVFDRFYKADTSRGIDKMGSGLGLSIVKTFVQAHGETVTVSGEPGKGCLFMFTLPLAVSS